MIECVMRDEHRICDQLQIIPSTVNRKKPLPIAITIAKPTPSDQIMDIRYTTSFIASSNRIGGNKTDWTILARWQKHNDNDRPPFLGLVSYAEHREC